jgi:hypothetical protein
VATANDRKAFVAVAAGEARRALANNRYSADVVAIARAETLPAIPDLRGTTRCRAGSTRLPATRSTTCADAGGSRSISMDRSTSSSSARAGDATSTDLSLLGSRIDGLAPSPPTRALSCW